MNKYDISRDDWSSLINILYNKINLYITQHTLLDYICVATSIRKLCESRDSEYTNFFDRNESRKLIDFLCTTYTNSYSLFCMYLSAMLFFFYPLHLYVFVLICQYYVILLERTNKDIILLEVGCSLAKYKLSSVTNRLLPVVCQEFCRVNSVFISPAIHI